MRTCPDWFYKFSFAALILIFLPLISACSENIGSLTPEPPSDDFPRSGELTPGTTTFQDPAYIKNEVLVVLTDEAEIKFKNGDTGFFDNQPLQITRTREYNWGTLHRTVITDGSSVEENVSRLKTNPDIRIAQPNHLVYFAKAPYWPNDPMWESDDPGDDPRDSTFEQWGPAKLGASIVWNDSIGDPNVTVAVIDTGVRFSHEDLENSYWINEDEIPDNGIDDDDNGYIDDWRGWNCFEGNNYPFDSNSSNYYHGTGCAGVIAAAQDNNIGMSGVAPGVKVMAIRADMNDGPTCETTVCDALSYAKDNGADIVSMSFYVIYATEVLEIHCADIWDSGNGPILMASAGNSNTTAVHYPAMYDTVICVGATIPWSNQGTPVDEQRIHIGWEGWWWGSTYGPNLTIMAFGEKYYSTYGSGDSEYWDGVNHWFFNGTSCACPNAAAVMALIKTFHPNETGQWYWDRIVETSDDLNVPGYDTQTGWGRVNAVRAVYGHDRYSDMEDDDGILTVSLDGESVRFTQPFFDSIHDVSTDNPYCDPSDIYRITAALDGIFKIDLDIFTWGENLDIGLYSDPDCLDLIVESTIENHANSSFETITTSSTAGSEYYLKVYSPALGNSTTYGLTIAYL